MKSVPNSIKLVAWFRIFGAHSQKRKDFLGLSLPLNKESGWIMYSTANVSLKFIFFRQELVIKVLHGNDSAATLKVKDHA